MAPKPKIQYVGQFYVYGSEARALEVEAQKEKPKTKLPKIRLDRFQKLYIDPVALGGLLVAALILVALALGMNKLDESWQEHNRMSAYLTELKRSNATLSHSYHTGYDADAVREAAKSVGYIENENAQYMLITPRVPKKAAEPTWKDDVIWFVKSLLGKYEPKGAVVLDLKNPPAAD